MTPEEMTKEALKCLRSSSYFARTYCQIMSGEDRDWVPFSLWSEQERTLRTIEESKLTVILKARQLGLTWLCLSYALWEFLFHPGSLVLLFSRRDDEAVDLLKRRFVGMHSRLPDFLRSDPITISNDHEFAIASDSRVKAFPTTAGDSYTANLAIVDEADLIPDLDDLMASVKPTIDAPGNKLVLLSRVDKKTPESTFKRTYKAAKAGENRWVPVFLPWFARPDRDDAWYEEQKRDVLSRTGATDALYEQYPATDAEALAPNSLDKRIPGEWLAKCYTEQAPVYSALFLPGLRLFVEPILEARYVIGADPAEGNPTSDDSAACVLEVNSGQQVAVLQGKIEPTVFADYLARLAKHFNGARVLVERNNHGHAVLAGLADGVTHRVYGPDGNPGWLSNARGKALMYSSLADSVQSGDCVIHDFPTFHQVANIEGATLRAPKGQHDDMADAFALACVAREKTPSGPLPVQKPLKLVERPKLFGGEPQSKAMESAREQRANRRDGLPDRWKAKPGLFGRR